MQRGLGVWGGAGLVETTPPSTGVIQLANANSTEQESATEALLGHTEEKVQKAEVGTHYWFAGAYRPQLQRHFKLPRE